MGAVKSGKFVNDHGQGIGISQVREWENRLGAQISSQYLLEWMLSMMGEFGLRKQLCNCSVSKTAGRGGRVCVRSAVLSFRHGFQ